MPSTSEKPASVPITHPERVLWPDEGITKQDLIDYLRAVGDLLIEELAGRLLTLVRAPGGVRGETFFQKNAPSYTPDWIKTITVPAPSAKRDVRFLVCDSIDTLLWIGNQSGLELHPSLDRDSKPGRPDLLVFDMDPPEGRFDMAAEGALLVRDALKGMGLRPLLKTTGGKGLHVYLRIERRYGFPETHAFARKVAERVASRADSLLTLEFSKAERRGRVFVDVHRNGPGATLIAPFSPRAQPGGLVSFPITWGELPKASPDDYNLRTVPKMLRSKGVTAWKKGHKDKQRLPSV